MELLQEYPDINGFYCAEGFSSATVGKVLEELQTDRQFTIVCFGIPDRVEDYIESGMYAASLLQDTYGMGANAAEYLYDYLNGRGAQTDAIYTDMIVVRKENLQDADNMEGPQGDEIIWQIY